MTYVSHARGLLLVDEWIQQHQKLAESLRATSEFWIDYTNVPSQPMNILEKTQAHVKCTAVRTPCAISVQNAFERLKECSEDTRMAILSLDDFLVVQGPLLLMQTKHVLNRFFFRPSPRGSCLLKSTYRNSTSDHENASQLWRPLFVAPQDSIQWSTTSSGQATLESPTLGPPKSQMVPVPDLQVATYLKTKDLFSDSRCTWDTFARSNFSYLDQTLSDIFLS